MKAAVDLAQHLTKECGASGCGGVVYVWRKAKVWLECRRGRMQRGLALAHLRCRYAHEPFVGLRMEVQLEVMLHQEASRFNHACHVNQEAARRCRSVADPGVYTWHARCMNECL